MLNQQLGSSYGYAYATIKSDNEKFPESDQVCGRFIYASENYNAKDYIADTILKGGKKYYLYFGYQKKANSSVTWDQFAINNIKIYGLDFEQSKAEVNGGVIRADSATGSFSTCTIYNETDLKITGGTIYGYNSCMLSSEISYYGYVYGVYNLASLEITGGIFKGKNDSYATSSYGQVYEYPTSGIYSKSIEEIFIDNAIMIDSFNGFYNEDGNTSRISNVTINNCNRAMKNTKANKIILTGYCKIKNSYIQNNGNFIMEGADIIGSYICNYNNLKMNGGSITGGDYGIQNYQDGIVEIENGTIVANQYGIYLTGNTNTKIGNVHIKRGVIEGNKNGIYGTSKIPIIIGEKNGVVDDNQVKITGKTDKGTNTVGNVLFYDGKIEGKTEAFLGIISDIEDNYNIILKNSEEIENGKEAILEMRTGIAYIEPNSTVLFNSLQEAIDTCGDNETITLVKDTIITDDDQIEIMDNKNVIINVNGKSITVFGKLFINYGTVRLTDLLEETTSNVQGYSESLIINENSGKLVIEKVKISNILNDQTSKVIQNKGELNIESGILEKTTTSGYIISNEGQMEDEDISENVLGEWVGLGEYYFEEQNGVHKSNNTPANTTANSYVKVDLKNKTGIYYLTVDMECNSSDIRYVTIKENNDEIPTYSDIEGEFFCKKDGYRTEDCFTILQGGKEYYLYFGFVKDSSSGIYASFTIKNIKIRKMNLAITNMNGGTINGKDCVENKIGVFYANGGEINTSRVAIYNNTSGIVKIDGGSIISSVSNSAIQNYGYIEMNGGNITAYTGIENCEKGKTIMNGGVIDTTYIGLSNRSLLKMTGGKINITGTSSSFISAGIKADGFAITKISGGIITITNNANGVRNNASGLIEITKVSITGTGANSYGIYNASTGEVILGKKDGIVDWENIIVKIKNGYGISNKLGSLKFYDGILGGNEEKSIEGTITDYEDKYTLVTYKYGETEIHEIEENQEISLLERIFVAHVTSCDTQYEDIYEAVENLADTDTLTILHDVSTNEELGPLIIDEDKEIILDLNGNTVKGNTESVLLNKGKLTIKDGKEGGVLYSAQNVIHNKGILNIESGSIEGLGNIAEYGTNESYGIYNEATIGDEITEEVLGELTNAGEYYFEEIGGEYISNNYQKSTTANSYMKIDLRDKEGIYMLDVNASISSSTINYGYITLKEQNEKIPDSNDEDGRLIYISGNKTQNETISLCGGNEYYLYFGYVRNSYSTQEDDEFTVKSVKIYTNKAIVNLQNGSIEKAITLNSDVKAYAVKNTGYIKMSGGTIIANAFANKTSTNANADSIGIKNEGWLDIIGGTITSEAKATSSSSSSSSKKNAYAYGVSNDVNAKLEVTGGTINSTATASTRQTAYGIYNDSSETLKVLGGTISAGYGIYNNSTGDIELKCEIVSSGTCIYNKSTGNIKMTGGMLNASGGSGIVNSNTGIVEIIEGSILVSSSGIDNWLGKIVIGEKDGIFHDNTIKISSRNSYGICQRELSEVDFYDGTIIGKNIAIYGPINEIEEGYDLVFESTDEMANGEKATLGKQLDVAYVEPNNTVLYDSIQNAINACGDEGTVTLVKDITNVECQKGITNENSNITFDLNGHSIRAYGCVIDNYGTMKLIDTVEESTGSIYGYAENLIANETSGTLECENVKIDNIFSCAKVKGIYNKGELYFKSGKIEANVSGTYAIYNEGAPGKEIDTEEIIGDLVSTGAYYFIQDEEGKYVANNDNKNGSTANSYMKIDLTDKEGYYFIKVNATQLSDYRYDYGYVSIKEIYEGNSSSSKTILNMSGDGTDETSEALYILECGKEYHLEFRYVKASDSTSRKGGFIINSIKMFENRTVTNIEGGEIEGYYGLGNQDAFINIIDGKINAIYCGIYEDSKILTKKESINIINGTIETTKNGSTYGVSSNYGIYNNASNTIVINGGNIIVSTYGIYNNQTGETKINGGSITAAYGIYNYASNTVEMNGGTITATEYGIYNYSTNGKVTVTGGSITVSRTSYSCYGIYNKGMVILGKLDNEEPSTEIPSITASSTSGTAYAVCGSNTSAKFYFYDGILNGSTAAIYGNVTAVPEHYKIGLRNDGKTAMLEVDADFENTIQVNGIFYVSLQEAVNAIAESNSKEGTILLWDDLRSLTDGVVIPENVEVTLALEGHLVQFKDLATAITNNGTFNIIDFEDIEEGDADTTSMVKNTTGIVIANNGILTLGQEGNKNANSPVIEGVPAVSGTAPEIKSGKLVNTTVSGASGSLNSIHKIAGSRKELLSGILEILGSTKLSSEVTMKPSSTLPDWTKNDVIVDLTGSVYGILNLYAGGRTVEPKDISYTVEYYKDNIKVEEDTIVKIETVAGTAPDTLTLDRTLITNNDKYYGYCIDRTEPATVENTVNHGDVIKVYYKIDETKVKELTYTVEYYKGTTKIEEDTVIKKQNVQVLQPDTIAIDRTLLTNNDKYLGYCIDRTEPAVVEDTVSTGTTIQVYYKMDETKTKELSYTVEYYKDNIKVEADTIVKTKTVYILNPDTLNIDRTLITNNDKYYGYCIDRTEPATVENTVDTGTIIKVYYKVDETKVKEVNYTVEYYKSNMKIEADTVVVRQNVQVLQPDTIAIDRTLLTNNEKYTGYCIDRTEPATVENTVDTGTTIKVYYKVDGTQAKTLTYTIEYYKDEIKVEEDTTVITARVHILEPDTVLVDRDLIANNKYYGYCIDRTEPTTIPNAIDTGETIKVYYKVDETQVKTLSYTVEYYQGERKVDTDTVVRTTSVQVLQPDTIAIDRTLITNNDKYYGYYLERTDPVTVEDIVNTGTIIKVYYQVDETKTKDLYYIVEYYKAEEKVEEDTIIVRQTVQVLQPNTLVVDRNLITNQNKYEGYHISRTDPRNIEETVNTETTIKVYYTLRNDLSYTVNYYKEGTTEKIEESKIARNQTYGTTIYTENEAKAIRGYKVVGYSEESIIIGLGENVISIYYAEDETQTKEIKYTVEYYKGTRKVETDTVVVKETVRVLAPDTLTVDRTLFTDNNKYVGYQLDRTDPEEVPEVVDNGTIIRVYYKPISGLSYTVNYYRNGTTEKLEPSKVVENQSYGTIIYAEDEAKAIRGYKVVGYSEESITIGLEENVLDIYYELDETQTKTISYMVEYYKGTTKVEEDTIIVTNIVHALGTETLTVDRTLFTDTDKYEGYHLDRTDPEEVPEVVDNGTVIKVYYEKTAYAYRVEYYYNEQIDETATEYGTAYLGDTIQECPSKPKEGYEFDRTENLPLEISSTRENVIRVYYVAVRKVTIEHIDKETEEVLEREVKVGKQGTKVRTEAKEIEGYRLVEKPAKEEYILENEDIVVRYYYEKVKQEPTPTPREDEKEPEKQPEEEQPTPTEPEERREEPTPKETHVIPVTQDEPKPTTDNTITTNKLPRTGYRRIIIPLVIVITMAGLVFYQKYQNVGKKKKKK